jgi:O-succinylbenzoic acid--CoA ligase
MVFPAENQSLAEAIQMHTVSHISLVSAQLKRLMDEKTDFTSLKAVLLGGGSIPQELIRSASQHRIPVHVSYGSTEMASQVATSPATVAEDGMKILKYREARVSDDGEVLLRGASLSPGYLTGNQITPLLEEDGWFHSGDLGKVNNDGNLIITGRKDSLFISGGENIFPEEIENHLLAHPDIERALVVAVPDKEFGERPVAFILGATDRDLDKIAMRDYLRDKIEGFKIPDEFLPWPAGEIRLKNDRQAFKEIALNHLSK